MPGEFEATAAAFAAVPATDGSGLAAVPAPDGSEVPAAVFGVAPPAGGPRAPEIAKAEIPAEMPILTAVPAITPTAMAATKPEPLVAMTETPATTTAKPVQLAALAVPLPSMDAKPKLGRFVVLGSYLNEANARDAMKRGDEFQPRMVRVRVRGKLFHRVVSGPFARGTIATMRRTLIGEGFPDAWIAKLCQSTLRLAPCPTAPLPLNLTSN